MSSREIDLQPLIQTAETPAPLPMLGTDALSPLGPEEASEPEGEAALPTAVLDRRAGFSARLAPGGYVGPYALQTLLRHAPGASFYKALSPEGEPVMLQAIRLKSVDSSAARVERLYVERRLAAATRFLDDGVLAHGGADDGDGDRVLFWVLPLPATLVHEAELAPDTESLLVLARALASYLHERHENGGRAPLLSEHVLAGCAETPELLGVPILAPREWLSPGTAPRRLAPEESIAGDVKKSGDLFRLGRTLAVLAARHVLVPATLAQIIARLTRPDPEQRGSVEVLIAELSQLDLGHVASADETVSMGSLSPDDLDALFMSAAPSTHFQAMDLPAGPDFTAEAAAIALFSAGRAGGTPFPEHLRHAARPKGPVQETERRAEAVVVLRQIQAPTLAPPPPSPPAPRARILTRMLGGLVAALVLGALLGVLSSQCFSPHGSNDPVPGGPGGKLALLR